MCIEFSPIGYIDSRDSLLAKIIAIDEITLNNITLIGVVTSGVGGSTASYELDDGQVRIKTTYRSVAEILKANTGLETMKTLYAQRLNGRVTVLRSSLTIRGGNCQC